LLRGDRADDRYLLESRLQAQPGFSLVAVVCCAETKPTTATGVKGPDPSLGMPVRALL
jgi:hypothetical protein